MISQDSPLRMFLAPRGVVLVGSGPLAAGLAENLAASSLAVRCHAVVGADPAYAGLACYARIEDIAAPLSLALIATPPDAVTAVLRACAAKGIHAAIVYTADMRGDLDAAVTREARLHGIRVWGPNALGLVLPHADINLMPLRRKVPAGKIALVSQSCAVCAGILDWSHNDEFGFSGLYGPGLASRDELPHILDHLASDLKTGCILLYLEGIQDARRFLSAVRAAASSKPVIAVKAGQHAAVADVAAAHSGSLTDRDDTFDAALRRAGALRVKSIGDMFSAARALTAPNKPRGNRLAIVANGGGHAVMAADHAAAHGIELAVLAADTRTCLDALGAARWSGANPVDVGLTASPDQFAAALAACAADPGVDGILMILTPNSFEAPLGIAEAVIAAVGDADKPILACLMGEVDARPARARLAQAHFPIFRTPENAVAAFSFAVTWVRNQALLLEMPAALSTYHDPDTAAAQAVIDTALAQERQWLTPDQARAVLKAFHIPVAPGERVTTPTEAVALANRYGYPVVMKRGSFQLDLEAPQRLRSAPEVAMVFRELAAGGGEVWLEPKVDKPEGRWLAIAIRIDRVFGPIITLSEAGIAAEIYDARSIALPPLNPRLVAEMIGVPHVAKLLGPLRDTPPVAEAPLRELLLRISELASELPGLKLADFIITADATSATVLDAKIEIAAVRPDRARYAHMAIYPYPAQLARECTLKDGTICTIRPIRPEDAMALQDFVRALSSRSRYFRFFSSMAELPRNALARFTQIDYSRELTLVAIAENEEGWKIIGEANYGVLPDGKTCEFAVLIADTMGGKGLGSRLVRALMAAAREQGLKTIKGEVLADNEAMLALMDALDFIVQLTDEPDVLLVSHAL